MAGDQGHGLNEVEVAELKGLGNHMRKFKKETGACGEAGALRQLVSTGSSKRWRRKEECAHQGWPEELESES